MMDQKQNAVEQDARSVARIETTVDDTLLKSVAWICKHYKRERVKRRWSPACQKRRCCRRRRR